MYSVVLMAALTTGADLPSWHRSHGCNGCYGGYSCGGCYGGCSGGYSGYSCYGCYGNYGAYPGCWGGCNGCYGCHGCYGCYGCYGCSGKYAPPIMVQPGGAAPAPETVKPKEKTTSTASPAKLLVEIPADAKLFVDDLPMKTPADRREFNTPALEKGTTYYYIVRAEVMRDGKTVSESKRVIVRAGESVTADFSNLGNVAAVKKEAPAESTGGQ